MKDKPWQDWIILAASGWLFFSPFVLGFATRDTPATLVAFVCAIMLYASAAEALVVPDALEEWLDGAVGLALIASPWLAGYGHDLVAAVNAVVTGGIVVVFAVLALARDLRTAPQGHHFSAG